ncbi:hypothetical protein SLEP1_g27637 [Rubroshorea leprosula]|uniref:Uncharacterized protein n=1 Tax=Rubroshorea leprosula TaxID=152421 RepID=A0AAV5JWL7_9ROSI|nr:hypothetical protein SLEP1_g27637 [Rubroshorea leprosula]
MNPACETGFATGLAVNPARVIGLAMNPARAWCRRESMLLGSSRIHAPGFVANPRAGFITTNPRAGFIATTPRASFSHLRCASSCHFVFSQFLLFGHRKSLAAPIGTVLLPPRRSNYS